MISGKNKKFEGGPVQLKCFQTQSCTDMLNDNHITACKLPASTSAIFQPADVGSCSQNTKQTLKKRGSGEDVIHEAAEDDLKQIFQEYCRKKETKMMYTRINEQIHGILRTRGRMSRRTQPRSHFLDRACGVTRSKAHTSIKPFSKVEQKLARK